MNIGISLVSYLPWAACPFYVSAEKAARWAWEAGYTFLETPPLRTVGPWINNVLRVKYVDDAWNPANTRRGADINVPQTLADILFFPPVERCVAIFDAFRSLGATYVTHHWDEFEEDPSTLLEVHPGLWMTPEEIAEKVSGCRLVLDLYHLRRAPRQDNIAHKPAYIKGTQSLLGDWRNAMKLLLPLTRVIHVAPNRDTKEELRRFLNGEPTELAQMLHMAKAYVKEYVVEIQAFSARAPLPSQTRGIAALFREQLAAVLVSV